MKCKICSATTQKLFAARILLKYDVQYFYCAACGFLQTEEPYWLDEAYKEPISITDTGVIARNVSLSKIAASVIYFLYNKDGAFLDFAGGYGLLTRLMRDIGFDFYWQDLYTNNIFAKGFEFSSGQKSIDLITSFECFEHLPHPLSDIEKMLAISPNVLFTTDLLPNPVPAPEQWWYYACDQGQHISFYSRKTLEYIAQKYGLYIHSHWGMHLLTKKKIAPLFFNKAIEYHKKWLFPFVAKRMKSKAVADMQYLKKQHHDISSIY